MSLKLPTNLVVGAEHVGRSALRSWISSLPDVIEALNARWDLRQIGPPYDPGGQCSWVAPVVDATGQQLVLKVGWRHPEAMHEADALRLWDGNGAVLLHAAHEDDETTALLLERCEPGHPLKDMLTEPEQDVVVAALLRQLWREPPAPHRFRHLQVMCDAWAGQFEAKLAARPMSLDAGLARSAVDSFRSLPASASDCVVLCTDLHAENILAARRHPWLVIDPKPYVGDPTYDALQHMLNCDERLAADPGALTSRMADLLRLDADRLSLWLFARCILESLERPRLLDVALRIALA